MTKHPSNESNNMWYLDSCALKYICQNQELLLDLQFKNYEFSMVGEEIIQFQEIRIVYFFVQSQKITLLNVIYVMI